MRNGESTTWTADLDRRVTALLHHGCSASEIARRLGVSRNAVLGRLFRLKGNGHERPPSRSNQKWTPDMDGDFIDLWYAGVPRQEIAAHFGISIGNVGFRANYLGCPRRENLRSLQ